MPTTCLTRSVVGSELQTYVLSPIRVTTSLFAYYGVPSLQFLLNA